MSRYARTLALAFAISSITNGLSAADAIITTIAGGKTSGFAGDGGPATAAQFRECRSLAIDSGGNLYVTDRGNNRIRKIDTTGIITTIAGTGAEGFGGDNGPATAAQLNQPREIAIDSEDFLYICDEGNNRVRCIDLLSGIIQTVCGDGNNVNSGDGGPASAAQISNPESICFDSSFNVYIGAQQTIRRIDAMGIITTIAGTGAQGFSGDGGPAINAQFSEIDGLAVDAAGNLYVVDVNNNRIRRIDTMGIVTTVAGTGNAGFSGDGGPALNADLGFPGDGITIDKFGNIYFGDYGASEREPRIRRIDTNGIISTVAGNGQPGISGDGGLATNAKTIGAVGIVADAAGDIYFAGSVDAEFEGKDLGAVIRKLTFGDPNFARNPDNGLAVEVTGRAGGMYELTINPDGIVTRAPFTLNTQFDDLQGRDELVPGRVARHQYIQAGIFVATTTATDSATSMEAGKQRKTLAVSRSETGESPLVGAEPNSRGVDQFKMSGKFVFTDAKPDAVKFDGVLTLPSGLDLSQPQSFSLGIGNVTDTITIDAKGKGQLPSQNSRIKKVQVKLPKPANGAVTGEGQTAKVSVQLVLPRLDLAGFDTEGITKNARTIDPTAKSYPREIQVAFLLAGVTYELKAPVNYTLTKTASAGSIKGRVAR
jgi:hypothetical protein